MVIVMLLPILSIIVNVNIPDIPEAEASPVTVRYACHQTTDFRNGTGAITSGLPCWVKGSPYTKWVLTSYSDRIEMKNGLYGAMLNTSDSTNRIYDLYYHNLKSTEEWRVEYWNNGWVDSGINSVTPTISTLQNDTGIFVKSVRENSEIELTIEYITLEGQPLKHHVTVENKGSEKEFRIIQRHEIDGAEYFSWHGGRTLIQHSAGITVDSRNVEFEHENQTLIVQEAQESEYYRNVTVFDTDDGARADFLFGNVVNRTAMLLDENESYRLESGATCSNTDQKCHKRGYGARWIMSCSSASDGCTIDTASSQRSSQVSGTGAGQTWDLDDVGKEDGRRAYLWLTVFDMANVTNGADISNVVIGMGSDFKVNGDNGAPDVNLELHVVDNDSCSAIDDLSPNAGFSDNTLGTNILSAPVVSKTAHGSGFGAAAASTNIDLDDHANRYISQRTASSANSTDNDIACIAFSQHGTDLGGTASQRYHYNMDGPHMNITVTYSTTTYYTTRIDLKLFDDSTALDFGDPQVEFWSRNGTKNTFKDCDHTIGSGSNIGTCYVLTNSEDDGPTSIFVRWAGNGQTSGHKGLKVEGFDRYNFSNPGSGTTQTLTLKTSVYKGTKLMFYDNNGQLNTPQNISTKFANGTAITVASGAFDSKGLESIGFVTNGTGGGPGAPTATCTTLKTCNRIQNVYALGDDRVANMTAWYNVTADSQTFSFRQKVYVANLDFVSMDYALNLDTKVTSVSFSLPNGTVGDVFRPAATSAGAGSHSMQIGNDSLTLTAARFQGQNMIRNSTAFTIGSNGVSGNRGGTFDCMSDNVCTTQELTHVIQLQYYPVTWNFKSNDHILAITPSNFQHLAPNGTEITQTDFTKISRYGNGTITPKGVTYQGQGMIKNDTAITINEAETNLINLQYYPITFTTSLGATHADADNNPGVVYYEITGTNSSDLGKVVSDSQGKLTTGYMGNGTLQYRVWWQGGTTGNTDIMIIIAESPTDALFSHTVSVSTTTIATETEAIAISGDNSFIGILAVNRTDITSYTWVSEGKELRLGTVNVNATGRAGLVHDGFTMLVMNVTEANTAFGDPITISEGGSVYGPSSETWRGLFSEKAFAFLLEQGEKDIKMNFVTTGSGGGGGGGGGAGQIFDAGNSLLFPRLFDPTLVTPENVSAIATPILAEEADYVMVQLGATDWQIPVSGMSGATFFALVALSSVFLIGGIAQLGTSAGRNNNKPKSLEDLFGAQKKRRRGGLL